MRLSKGNKQEINNAAIGIRAAYFIKKVNQEARKKWNRKRLELKMKMVCAYGVRN